MLGEEPVTVAAARPGAAMARRRAGLLPPVGEPSWLDAMPGLADASAGWAEELAGVRAAIPGRVDDLLHPDAGGRSRRRRFARVAAVLASEGLRLGALDAPAAAVRRRPTGPAAAHRLRRAFERLGPSYLKLGQFISSGQGLFPDALVEEFASCRDRCPQLPAKVARAVVARELGRPVDEVFSWFEDEPLAAASIAQVHRATMREDGRAVVVKVQRPGIAREIEAHTRTMPALAELVVRLFPQAPVADPHAVVRLFATTILHELDFRLEAQNMVDVALDLEAAAVTDVVVPHPVPGLVTERVLVMERFDGMRFDDLDEMRTAGIDTAALLLAGLRSLVEGATVFGRFHGDLHAGNVIALPDGRFGLVDFGICARLSPEERGGLRRLLIGISTGDPVAQVAGLDAVGALPATIDRRRLLGLLTLARSDERASSLSVDDLRDGAPRVMRIFTEHKLLLPPGLVLFFKDVLYLNGSTRLLAPDLDLLALFGSLHEHFGAKYGADVAPADVADDLGGPATEEELAALEAERFEAAAGVVPAEPPTVRSSLRRFGPELVRSALVPMVLFVFLEHRLGLATAILGVSAWTVGLTAVQRLRGRRSSVAWITLFFVVVRGAVGLISGSGVLYFLPDILNNFVYGLALAATVAVRKPALGLAARFFYPFPPAARQHPTFRRVFSRLTMLWAGWLVGSGLVQLWLLLTLDPSTFMVAKRAIGIPGTIVLFVVSLRYPRRVFEADAGLAALLGGTSPSVVEGAIA